MSKILAIIEAGSRLYGTATPQSDSDRKAIVIPDSREILLGRVRKAVVSATVGEGADTVQTETYSLDFFLNLVTQGQPIAVELLFAPRSAHIVEPDPLWLELINNRDRLLTRRTANFADYCKRQATVYSDKGARAAAIRAALSCIEGGVERHGSQMRLGVLAEPIQVLAEQHRQTMAIETKTSAGGDRFGLWIVAGRALSFTTRLRDAASILNGALAQYGERALAAEAAGGVDFKAISHAVRIASEAVELLETGRIVFPRTNAPHLRDIRLGRVSPDAVWKEIDRLLIDIEAAGPESQLPDEVDLDFIEDFLVHAYEVAVSSPARDEIADLMEALLDAAAHLAAATSAYEKFVGRQESAGLRRGVSDPLFATRYGDFVKASERASAAARRAVGLQNDALHQACEPDFSTAEAHDASANPEI